MILSEHGAAAGQCLFNTYTCLKQIGAIDKLISVIKTSGKCNLKEVSKLLTGQKLDGLTNCDILKKLSDQKLSHARSCIIISAFQSTVLIATEFILIYTVWTEIDKQNAIIKESKEKLNKIRERIQALLKPLKDIMKIVDLYIKSSDLNERQKESIINSMRIKTENFKQELWKIRIEISMLNIMLE